MRILLQELKSSLRSLRQNSAFAATMVVTLALGIAPNCVIFTIMDGIYFRPLPYPQQARLALLNVSHKSKAATDDVDMFTFLEWQRRSTSFEALAAYRNSGLNVTFEDRPERIPGQLVTADFFRTVGMTPVLGRPFRKEDCLPGAPHVLVISHRAWRDTFSGRTDIVNLAVRVNGKPSTVIGVMPPEFTSFMEGRSARAWAPLTSDVGSTPRDVRAGNVIGRLKAGIPVERARAELESIQSTLAAEHPDFYIDRGAAIRDFRDSLFGGLGPGIRMLSVIVGLLLLIACANAANLLLGRAVQRVRDVAIRTALGARRAQLVRRLLTESLLLSLAAALLGLVIAYWGIRLVWMQSAPIFTLIGVDGFAFDHRVVAFTLELTVVTMALFGVVPALRGSRVDIASALKDGTSGQGRGTRHGRMSKVLVVAQVALCVMTMIVTALMLRSFLHFSHLSSNPGFNPRRLLVATLPQPGETPPGPGARLAFLEDTEKRIAAEPGVERVALTNRLPFLESGAPVVLSKRATSADGQPGERIDADARTVNPDFFSVMSIQLVKGRTFTPQDNQNNLPVVVIDERLATALWNGKDPLGDRILVDGSWRTIVGVVASNVEASPFRKSSREVFLPYFQAPAADMKLIVQSARPLDSLSAAVRRQIRAVDPDQPLVDLQSMDEALDGFMTPFRLILVLITLFGTIALALAAVGLYGVVAHGVSRRTREIGVRMALGAGQAEVVSMVVWEGLRPATLGLVVGLLLGIALARILPSEILGVRGLSFYHYAGTVTIWFGVALVACLIPARRAARVNALSALRCE